MTTVITVLAALYGLCIGSFLNVVVYRLPAGMKMTNERSMCPKCHAMIHWYDNIPLLSYLVLGGKCRACREPISPRYPIVEAVNMAGWVLSALVFRDNLPGAALAAAAFSVMVCVFLIDLEHLIIYDRFQIILGLLGVGMIFADSFASWQSHLIGGAAGFLGFWAIGAGVSRMVGKDALGMGDVKLAGVMGLFLGWEKLLLGVLLSSVAALVIILISRRRTGYGNDHEYPFGPFLAAGFAVSMLAGDYLIPLYLSLLGVTR